MGLVTGLPEFAIWELSPSGSWLSKLLGVARELLNAIKIFTCKHECSFSFTDYPGLPQLALLPAEPGD